MLFNHEVWRVCEKCGSWYDLRMSSTCDECKHVNKPFKTMRIAVIIVMSICVLACKKEIVEPMKKPCISADSLQKLFHKKKIMI